MNLTRRLCYYTHYEYTFSIFSRALQDERFHMCLAIRNLKINTTKREERGVRCTIEEQDLAHRCIEIISSEDYWYQKHDSECAGLGSLAAMSSGRTGALERQADGRRLEQGPRIGVLDAGNNTSTKWWLCCLHFYPRSCALSRRVRCPDISHHTVAYMLPLHSERNRHSLK